MENQGLRILKKGENTWSKWQQLSKSKNWHNQITILTKNGKQNCTEMNPQRGSMNVCCGIDQPNKERANRDAMPCQLLSFLHKNLSSPTSIFPIPQYNTILIPLSNQGDLLLSLLFVSDHSVPLSLFLFAFPCYILKGSSLIGG